MYKYYCPECGKEGTGRDGENLFRITLRGVFKAGDDAEDVHPEYLFLHDDVRMSDDPDDYQGEVQLIGAAMRAFAAQQGNASDTGNPADISGHDDDSETVYIIPDDDSDIETEYHEEPDFDVYASAAQRSVSYGGQQYQDESQRKYMEYLQMADQHKLRIFADYRMDISQPDSEECRRYVWAVLFTKKLAELLKNSNQILDYLLSADLTDARKPEDVSWCEQDLKQTVTEENNDAVFRQIADIADDKTKNSLKDWMDEVMIIITMLNCTHKAIIRSRSEVYEFLKASAMTVGGQQFLSSLRIGKRQVFKRICPNCGAHISKYLGMYPQKIISFIGKPSSGKSNIIVALFALLNGDGNDTINGLQCGFDLDDPQYSSYMDVFHLHQQKLSAPKTEKDVFPALTVKLSFNNHVMLYTFLDCPGEFFDAKNKVEANQTANMSHLEAMKHSDAVCVVVSGEQLIKQEKIGLPEHSATEYDDNPDVFLTRIGMFKETVLNGANPPVFFIISKPDVLKPKAHETWTDQNSGMEYWIQSSTDPNLRIEISKVKDLFSWLKYETRRFYWTISTPQDAREIPPGVINMSKLHTIQYRSQDFIAAIEDPNQLLDRLYSRLCTADIYSNKTWRIVPTFMISPFGFYAVKDIWQAETTLKLKMIENWTKLQADESEKQALAKARSRVDAGAVRKTDGSKTVFEFCGITSEEFEEMLLKQYQSDHTEHSRYGANQFLLWLLVYTGLIGAVYQASQTDTDLHDLMNKEIAVGKFFMENCEAFRILQSASNWTALYDKLIQICEAAAERNAIDRGDKIERLGQEITELDAEKRRLSLREIFGGQRSRLETQIREKQELQAGLRAKRDKMQRMVEQGMNELKPYFREVFQSECNLSQFRGALSSILPD